MTIKVALLAPVPEEHLRAGLLVQEGHGKVAFGSNAWELLAELQAMLEGEQTEAYIYARSASIRGAGGGLLRLPLERGIAGSRPGMPPR